MILHAILEDTKHLRSIRNGNTWIIANTILFKGFPYMYIIDTQKRENNLTYRRIDKANFANCWATLSIKDIDEERFYTFSVVKHEEGHY